MHITPLFVTVGCTCIGGRGGSRHPTLHFSGWAQGQEHIWLTGRFVCRVSFLSFRFHNLSAYTHAHTHPHIHTHYTRTFCELTCCCAHKAAAMAHKQQTQHTSALLHKQTNTPAAPGKSLWQSAEGGKANKTNSLIYMTVACFTLACRGNDRVKLCWKQQVMKSDGPICGIV